MKSTSIKRCARGIAAGLLCALLGAPAGAQHLAAPPGTAPAGESIYLDGRLSSGQPLSAKRDASLAISGAEAACTNCHRRSGLGEIEGRVTIPPISGPYLFHPRAKDRDDLDLPYVDGMRPDRDPYTEASLARAIREGIGVDGRPLSYVMPRYDLDDAEMALLIQYLKTMTPSKVPGVTDSVLHFATIITPDADPIKRQAMLDVLNQFFTDKNAFARGASERMRSSHRMMFKANRHWMLHVWELKGPPGTWDKQLREHLLKERVFAVISGLGGKNWAPVHQFCEQVRLPCFFPNVELPVVAEHDFYTLYFSKGVLLEAELLARRLSDDESSSGPRRIVQIYRADDVGAAAAKSLTAALGGSSHKIVDRPMGTGDAQRQLAAALRDVGPGDSLVLWLRPADIAALASLTPHAADVLMSGLMGGLGGTPLPPAWREATHMSYPFDLPDKRRVRMDYPLGWFAIRHIPVVAEQVQTDTYLACGLVSDTLNHMADSFIRDYLVERVEGMLEHRIVTGYYPRLSLAPNQRFASKGGFIVHLADPSGARIVADSEWLTP
jgi:hypothetical protein